MRDFSVSRDIVDDPRGDGITRMMMPLPGSEVYKVDGVEVAREDFIRMAAEDGIIPSPAVDRRDPQR